MKIKKSIDSYLNGFDLSSYSCKSCGTSGVKIWRNFFPEDKNLLCNKCKEKEIKLIGSWIPAIPVKTSNNEGGYLFYSFDSAPSLAKKWWKGLPNSPNGTT
ncbi:MAG: hypothetical protein UR25_C0004G0044 [Candidatus Nomurabacteria bacterium GW2011_GWE1_32_28]|uniref:GATA-type domain-containing protein n=1 Tax=Candidatus Nomurabacteria bacterium GW2011_GWF1_31_48 TaxID=1618767 RepID=A0A0G0AU63_9BACT|nr:MAG: hypothetical protein UR10_C0004G0043 [Candidatus Nomurabacteria bacterium GW2011_GWF2_30_133]KKP28540.1 MAG: hypothetical protein UR18_C0003G0043 [Candidatus Nomurabacteria bacterium GW2011_GWE2_31_40]KKP30135.1 MAG: hypothetical protein UR19_C0004G0043 [Candidatus Nomurabacteria bacterium GW2011_GWF1_31_48]KKP34680.1 MAG: hypothetical protein UR25_C0004G0044 [Candidatus Nomurabacteria bacterium GW2011_GWE1_32_28]HAS80861.1 hypothetical protein [Candidatus Nomurabacteria bacterium]